MCIEWHSRFRRCGHTRFLRHDFCEDVDTPESAMECPRFERRFRDNQESYNCFECMHERAPPRQNSSSTGKSSTSRFGAFARRFLGCG